MTHFSLTNTNPDNINTLQITGDTIISEKACKILSSEYSTCDIRPQENYIYESGDSMFYFNGVDNDFELLYDFGLSVGDTIKLNYWEQEFAMDSVYYVTVLSEDSLMIGDQRHRILEVKYDNGYQTNINFETSFISAYWIEGYGSTVNFFHFPCIGLCDNRKNQCLKSINLENSFELEFDACITDTENLFHESIDFDLFPNPFKNEIILQSKSIEANKLQIKLLDQMGRDQSLSISKATNNEISINTSHLSSGLYFLVVYDKDLTSKRTFKIFKE